MTHETPKHPASGVVLHARAGVNEGVSSWLLTATESRDRSRMEWQKQGVTMLQTGMVFSAIRMSARLIHAAACTTDIRAVDEYLARALIGGPVIHDPDRCRYYALVPADHGPNWEVTRDLEPCGRGHYVGVPRPGLNTVADAKGAPYWSVPVEAAGVLCVPSVVAALVEIGCHELAGQSSASGAVVSPLPREGQR